MTIDEINKWLVRDYGFFKGSADPNFRIVWSHDQFEKRWSEYTDEGMKLLSPAVMLKPKYRQHIDDKYVLERALEVPEFAVTDLVDKWSYEPVYVFGVGRSQVSDLSPNFYDAVKYIIESLYKAARAQVGVKYKDPDISYDQEEMAYKEVVKINKMMEVLFPDETDVSTALGVREASVVPNNYEAKGTSLIKEN